eukprot:4665973-Amphidinium_carterae.1
MESQYLASMLSGVDRQLAGERRVEGTSDSHEPGPVTGTSRSVWMCNVVRSLRLARPFGWRSSPELAKAPVLS